MPSDRHHLLPLLLLAASCHGTQPAASQEPAAEPAAAPSAPTTDASVVEHTLGADLEPGSLRAFGVLMPLGAVERVSTDDSHGYTIAAPMPQVMRYLERRLDVGRAEIHPLGALLRDAHPRAAPGGEHMTLEVGVRQEGDQTLVTVWNRTTQPLPPRTPEEGMRAAGFDPRTGQPLPQNNY